MYEPGGNQRRKWCLMLKGHGGKSGELSFSSDSNKVSVQATEFFKDMIILE